jgi:hypothetical protein
LAGTTSAICVNSHTQSPTTRLSDDINTSHPHDYDHDPDDTHDSDLAQISIPQSTRDTSHRIRPWTRT